VAAVLWRDFPSDIAALASTWKDMNLTDSLPVSGSSGATSWSGRGIVYYI
jgi:hypothetical protein